MDIAIFITKIILPGIQIYHSSECRLECHSNLYLGHFILF